MKNLSITLVALLVGIFMFSCGGNSTGADPEPIPDPGNESGNEEEAPSYTLSVNVTPSEAGSVAPSSESSYEEGEEVELQANANEGYRFTGWTGDVEQADNPLTLTMDQDYAITANFEVKTYELTVHSEGEGDVHEEVVEGKNKEYDHGTTVELTADPEDGYRFAEWKGDITGAENPARITVDDPKEVTAVFEKIPANTSSSVSLSTSKKGKGSISVSSEQSGDGTYSNVTLLATPDKGWKFVKWEGDITSTEARLELKVSGALNLTAIFEQKR